MLSRRVTRDPVRWHSLSEALPAQCSTGARGLPPLDGVQDTKVTMNEGSNRSTGSGCDEQPVQREEPARAKILRLVPADGRNQRFVEMLEEWLEAARAGRLTSLVIAGIVEGDVETQFEGNYLEAIAELELAKIHILESMSEDE